MKIINCMICISIKVEKKVKLDMNFLFSVKVFFFCGETNKYFLLHQKIFEVFMHFH